ncbi:MAG: hypothetical protein C7B46_10230 [Sulfobacillus benefaciens]|uniref:Bacterial bifunctional deaminase-reductase C-terminal domain-containing protein n=1 Tax=Sulfobacillus benefaciens TaxID=453960 RepID=A0A2T2XFQ0_9FIRM|nr:MAG: hypothetical protein C7B46_10230 [Sulfobacillus benefaciens]
MRPQVVVVMGASVDGRITTAPGRNVGEWAAERLNGRAHDLLNGLYDRLACDGLMSGSESVLVWGNHEVALAFEPDWPKKSQAYIVFDGRGRIDWAYTKRLIVGTRENTPTSYYDQLRSKQIDNIKAGVGEYIDLGNALEQLFRRGFRKLALTGGGKINGAFLRAGLVDEISILWSPLLVGGETTPTIFEAPNLESWKGIVRLNLVQSEVWDSNLIWAHYRILRVNVGLT